MNGSHGFDFPLADLSPGQHAALEAALHREGIGHAWAGSTLQVDIAYEARVTNLVDQARGGVLPAAPQSGPMPPGPMASMPPTAPGVAPTAPYPAAYPVAAAPPASPASYGTGGGAGYPTTGYGTAAGYYPTAYQTTNGLATAALVCGLASLACGLPLSIPAVVCGHIARRQIAESNGTQGGDGMALAGLIIGWIVNALTVLFIVVYIAIILIAVISSG
jgi:hypothetical protein